MPARNEGAAQRARASLRLLECLLGGAALLLCAALLIAAPGAQARPKSSASWAAAEIEKVSGAGVLGRPGADFRGQMPLTEGALATAIEATDKLQHPPAAPPAAPPATTPTTTTATTTTTTTTTEVAPSPPPVEVLSTIPSDATIAGVVRWTITVPGQSIESVAFAIDGVQQDLESQAPFSFARKHGGLSTTSIADGAHQFAVAAHLENGGTYVAVWNVTVANGALPAPAPLPGTATPVPITHAPAPPAVAAPVTVTVTVAGPATAAPAPQPQPAPTPAPLPTQPAPVLYRASLPESPVTVKQLDSALVAYLDLDPAAAEIQRTLEQAGLAPPPHTGSEVVARLLELRFDHPAAQDGLELLPDESVTRAEAAYSFARVLELGSSGSQWVQSLADGFALPGYTPWQKRVLATAVAYVGYPYVWGGTSPTAEDPFGVPSQGGFDCSGFVWRVYKLTSYPGEGDLASVLRGRTTYAMSGEVPRSERISEAELEPGDVMFFGNGPHSKPDEVGHTAIYVGGGWLIQSSGQGVTLAPFDGWYRTSFAWGRRPLREAGLV